MQPAALPRALPNRVANALAKANCLRTVLDAVSVCRGGGWSGRGRGRKPLNNGNYFGAKGQEIGKDQSDGAATSKVKVKGSASICISSHQAATLYSFSAAR